MMTSLFLTRTDTDNPDFRALVRRLDEYLMNVDGDDHAFYDQFNQLTGITHVVVAYTNDEPVGCGALKPFATGVMEVKRMFVQPAHRGRGVAQKIVAELEQWAHEDGYTEFVLETGKKQTAAIRLYEKCGYVPIPNYGQYVGVETSVCLCKQIRSAPSNAERELQ